MIGIRSMTSGMLLPCTIIKKSAWRLMLHLPETLIEVNRSNLNGPTTSRQWVRGSTIVTTSDASAFEGKDEIPDKVMTVGEWEHLLIGVCYKGIQCKLENDEELTEAQSRMFDEVMKNTGAKRD